MTPRHRIKPVVIREDEPPWYVQAAIVVTLGIAAAMVFAQWGMQP